MRLALTLALCLLPALAQATERRLEARAYHPKSGELIFVETHTEQWSGARQTSAEIVIRDTAGKAVVRRVVRFGEQPALPSLRFEDLRSGLRIDVVPEGKRVKIEKRRKGADIERETIEPAAPAAIAVGFTAVARDNWAQLEAGKSVKLSLVVAERLDWYRFRMRPRGRKKMKDRELLMVTMEPDSAMLRWVVDPIELGFDVKKKALFFYEGVTPVKDGDGDPIPARVFFEGALPGVSPTP